MQNPALAASKTNATSAISSSLQNLDGHPGISNTVLGITSSLWQLALDNGKKWCIIMPTLRGRAEAARRAHNPEVLGSNPSPAT